MAYHAVYPRHDRRITCLAGIGADGRGVRAIRSCGGTAARVRWRAVCARCVCVCVWVCVCVAASVCVLSSIVLRARAACACVRSRGVGGEAVERGAVCATGQSMGAAIVGTRASANGVCAISLARGFHSQAARRWPGRTAPAASAKTRQRSGQVSSYLRAGLRLRPGRAIKPISVSV